MPDASEEFWRPLARIRVLDFSMNLPGPMATSILCDLGALVIKVEPPAGDPARQLASGLFERVNRGKHSILLDLKREEDRHAALRIAAEVDIVVESFRPGVADRLGIGYKTISSINRKVIYLSASGFGASGPLSQHAGHDLTYLSLAGAMVLPGRWGDAPHRSGIPIADMMAAMVAANAVQAGLFERERSGAGRQLDVSLFEAALYCVGIRAGFGETPPTGHLHPSNDIFETRDANRVALALVEDHFWRRFVAVTQSIDPELGAERFSNAKLRRVNGAELQKRLENVVRKRTREEWLQIAAANDFALEPVLNPAEAISQPHVKDRAMIRSIDGKQHLPFPVAAGKGRVMPESLAIPELKTGHELIFELLGLLSK